MKRKRLAGRGGGEGGGRGRVYSRERIRAGVRENLKRLTDAGGRGGCGWSRMLSSMWQLFQASGPLV